MCGICGVATPSPERPIDRAVLERMAGSLRHRGPDGEGFFVGPGVGLGFRRLAIVDPEGGAQPIADERGEIHLICNGEIYNAPELRDELRSRGHVFASGSDVEVIVHLYEELGEGALDRLRGMFALALWDGRSRTLLLARDRLGIKPLCYAEAPDGSLWFGSEVKAILAGGAIGARLDPEGLADNLAFGGTVLGRTMFEGVRELGPGERLLCRGGRTERRVYWDLDLGVRDRGWSRGEWAGALRAKLEETVAVHLRADVPLASWLSPGIDSSALTALAAPMLDGPLTTYSLGFTESWADELRGAPTLDRLAGDGLAPVRVRYPADAASRLPWSVWHVEKPTHPTLPISTLAEATAAGGFKAALTGQGSDEQLAGYGWHLLDAVLAAPTRVAPAWARRALVGRGREGVAPRWRALACAPGATGAARYAALLSVVHHRPGIDAMAPWLARGVRAALAGDFGFRPPEGFGSWPRQHRLAYVEIKTRMVGYINHAVDRCAMGHGVEMRVPFLDHELAELIASAPPGVKRRGTRDKIVLREAMRGALPGAILERRKRGLFGPIPDPRHPSLDAVRGELMSERSLREKGYFEPRAVRRLLEAPGVGSNHRREALLMIFGVQVWDELFVRGRSGSLVG
jgi:asparagine synthase (glutamine-hydrolysing)